MRNQIICYRKHNQKICNKQIWSKITIKRRTSFMPIDPRLHWSEPLELDTELRFRLVYPVKRYKNTSADRIKLVRILWIRYWTGYLFSGMDINWTFHIAYQTCVQNRSIIGQQIYYELCTIATISFAIPNTCIDVLMITLNKVEFQILT